VEIGVVQNLKDDWNLHTRGVHIKFEDDKVFWSGELLDESSWGKMRGRVRGEWSIEEMIQPNVAKWNMTPKVFRLKQCVLPTKDSINNEAKLEQDLVRRRREEWNSPADKHKQTNTKSYRNVKSRHQGGTLQRERRDGWDESWSCWHGR
jgi:hypothetical protein